MICIFIVLIFSWLSEYAQTVRTVYLDKTDTGSNKFVVVRPAVKDIKGWLVLVPGMFQEPMDVLRQTNLPIVAAGQGLLTFIPVFGTGISSFGVDPVAQESMYKMLAYIDSSYRLAGKSLYLGGFSIGGSCVLKYAEEAIPGKSWFKPKAVFAIDAPLDFERMYNVMIREGRLQTAEKKSNEEADYMLNRFKEVFGGTPSENIGSYRQLSPFSFNDSLQSAIRPLHDLPLRFYTEPDIAFWLGEGADYSGMNAFDLAAVTNELKRMGNKNVSLITTNKKGFHNPGNQPMPHSWSIVDANDLVNWLLKFH